MVSLHAVTKRVAGGRTARSRYRWPIAAACLIPIAGGAVPRIASATASAQPYCSHYSGSGIPPGSHIPPWGFHATESLSGGRHGYSHGWGNIDLGASTISGRICQYVSHRGEPARAIAVRLQRHITYHTHYGRMWGYAGNIIKVDVTVVASTDPRCPVGTRGRVTMYGSYNGVRSDSIQFFFDSGCWYQSNLYHGPQVDAQVPPL
jgi:hypothetical protein